MKIVVEEFKGEGIEGIIIDTNKDPKLKRIWSKLEEDFNKKVYELQQKAEEQELKAIARYGDPVITPFILYN